VWSVKSAGSTGAAISGNNLTTTAEGTVTLTATIANGGAANTAYTQDFTITVNAFYAATNISGVPATAAVGTLTLSVTVAPSNATSKTIVWSVKSAGSTGASISGNNLTTTAEGTVTLTATIANGAAANAAYTQDFDIAVTLQAGSRIVLTLNGVWVSMWYVPEGSFQRDATATNVSVITKGYWLAETETTQQLFQAVMGSNPSYFSGTNLLVEQVNWYYAIAFCNKLSVANGKEAVYSVKVSGTEVNWASLTYAQIPTESNSDWNAVTMDTSKNGYRLPTEMEWMWAAMGAVKTSQPNTTGYTRAFAGSNGSIADNAWYYSNSGDKTQVVRRKISNQLGLYDMSGNVVEWCWDLYDSYPSGELTDFTGAASGPYREIRGGSIYSYAYECTVAFRSGYSSTGRKPPEGAAGAAGR
jgi:formylglycine-generating enzyme required for sulfatase activity